MGSSTQDIFGAAPAAAPATAGSYGLAPTGYRLPAATRLGAVRLQVADLARSLSFYERVLGLRIVERTDAGARLAAHGDDATLVELVERPGARPMTARGRLGLYHYAILLPDRSALGRFVAHLAESGVRAGAGDHLVSEAFYLQDPDGLGIEIYADRPRETWRRVDRELMMATDPVDVASLVEAAGDARWTGMPAGTVVGHVHLHVGDVARAGEFYADGIGFDRMVWQYPGALFLGAGGYHHHVGANTWAGSGARPPAADDARLLEWTIVLPGDGDVDAAADSLARGGHAVTRDGRDALATDPWGTAVRLRADR
ncbi:MAG: VOC family protein [Gemmatirosa sp.]